MANLLNLRESNMAPLQEDIDAMRVSLQQERALLRVLEDQIERVMPDHSQAALQLTRAQAALDAASRVFRTSDSMLQGLKRQRDHLEASIAEKCAALHPIRRVPAEILADILSQLVDIDEWEQVQFLDTKGYHSRSLPACIAVTSVCRFWRQISLATPSLWRKIVIPGRRSLKELKDHILEWSNRSNPRFVTLSLRNIGRENWSHGDAPLPELDALRWALMVLVDRVHRLEVNFLFASAIPAWSIIVSNPNNRFHNLSQMYISLNDPSPAQQSVVPDRTFQFHRLKKLEFFTLRNLWWNGQGGLRNLRVLKFELTSFPTELSHFISLLNNPSQLEEVEFLAVAATGLPNVTPTTLIDYPRLTRLTLCSKWLAHMQQELTHAISMTVLRALNLISCQPGAMSAREADSIGRFLSQNAPNVEALAINLRGEAISPQLLRIRSNELKTLEFIDTEVPTDVIEALNEPQSDPPTSTRWLLSSLRKLIFRDCDIAYDMTDTLTRLVSARSDTTTYLRPPPTKLEEVLVSHQGVVWTCP